MNPYSFPAPARRVDWADYAKGFCIIMVVMMHWRTYLDRKVLHFAYFYVLWVTIQFAVKAPMFAAAHGWDYVAAQYALAFIEPFGTLWFIYLLPIFFVVTKAARRVPPAVIWCAAAALQIAAIHTGWTAIDEFAGRFVYFYTGYLFAPQIFAFATTVQVRPGRAAAALAVWALVNGALVHAGLAEWPVVSLALGLVGAAAVIAFSALLARAHWFAPVRYCGQHSIVIYLAFFLPMAATRTLLLKTGIVPDVGTISLLVTAAGVVGALAMWWAARATGANFLFERPDRFRIAPCPRGAMQPAE